MEKWEEKIDKDIKRAEMMELIKNIQVDRAILRACIVNVWMLGLEQNCDYFFPPLTTLGHTLQAKRKKKRKAVKCSMGKGSRVLVRNDISNDY